VTPRLRRRLAGLSLRTRLLGLVVGLLATALFAVGTVSTVALGDRLIAQVDTELAAAGGRLAPPGGGGLPPFEPDEGSAPPAGFGQLDELAFLRRPGTSIGTLGAIIVDGVVQDATILSSASGELEPIDAEAAATLGELPADGTPSTVDIDGVGEYRLIAQQLPDDLVVIVGLPLDSVQTTIYRFIATEAVVGAVVIAIGAVAGGVIIRLALRPLNRVAATARRVASLELDRGEVALTERVPVHDTNPRTEVGQVGAALNRMLGHVEAALAARHDSEQQVRQFVADASHELRTPLAAIRGYAEFTGRNHERVPPDIARAMARVQAQAERMSGLVDDLLLLARLDAGRPLERSPVDLSLLIVDAVSDARVSRPDHRWRLELPEDAIVVTGDAARLHQVMANLLANAGTHTPTGTTVVTSVACDGGTVRVEVRDDGPGVPAELRPHLFQRFVRGDTSRSRAAHSTGLGLAIVDAVAAAHDGSVEVESQPGDTRFTVTLPSAEDRAGHSSVVK
jgi:two-component system OmpR family sensor kinase